MACRTWATSNMIIESRAPTRIDLAGGTVDLWPLHLFLKNPLTVNLAIDLWASTRLEEVISGSQNVILRSEDQQAEVKISWDDVLSDAPITVIPQLELHLKLLRFFARKKETRPQGGLTLTTLARSPAGAGLGGSSTLSVSMVGALATWARGGNPIDPTLEGEKFIDVVRDVETTVIQVPAGVQDYYGAMFGGLQALRWGTGTHGREWLPESTLKELEKRLMLFYSGQSRNSGINNWALFKAFIDQSADVRTRFEKISQSANDLESALRRLDWQDAGRAIASEWQTRRTLAEAISTPEINHAFEAAFREGATAGKVCGAGGGGCFFVYIPEPNEEIRAQIKSRIRSQIEAIGARLLPFRAVSRGLEIKVTRA